MAEDDKVAPIESAKKFKRIEDLMLCRNLISEGVMTHAAANCMGLPDQKAPMKGNFTSDADGKKSFWICLSPESFTTHGILLESVQLPLPIKFTVFIRDQPVICYECDLIEVKGDLLQFKTPEKMFFLQRRKSRRYRVPAAYEVWVEHFDPHYNRRLVRHRLYDISSGGISILVGPGESRFFTLGLKLNPVYLSLKGERHTVNIEVRTAGKELMKLGESSGVLIGMKFGKIDPRVQAAIDDYIDDGFARGQTGRTALE